MSADECCTGSVRKEGRGKGDRREKRLSLVVEDETVDKTKDVSRFLCMPTGA